MASPKPVPAERSPQANLSLEAIATLSNARLAELPPAALIAIIQQVEPHIPQPDWDVSLHDQDAAMLLKMAFCARECCRHLLSSADSDVQKCACDESSDCPHCS